jgi:hypothetical protein
MATYFPSDFNILENENNFDLDFFLFDSFKIIHISTAGMTLINSLRDLNFKNYNSNFKTVLNYRRTFNFELNVQLERDNTTERESYFSFFNLMAKRGFYSYDKVNIDNNEDYNFQLIAKPSYNRKIILNDKIELGNTLSKSNINYKLDFTRAKKDFPMDFEIFNISEYI